MLTLLSWSNVGDACVRSRGEYTYLRDCRVWHTIAVVEVSECVINGSS